LQIDEIFTFKILTILLYHILLHASIQSIEACLRHSNLLNELLSGKAYLNRNNLCKGIIYAMSEKFSTYSGYRSYREADPQSIIKCRLLHSNKGKETRKYTSENIFLMYKGYLALVAMERRPYHGSLVDVSTVENLGGRYVSTPDISSLATTGGLRADTEKVNVPVQSEKMECVSNNDLVKADLGINHIQCHNARLASMCVEATSISTDSTFGKRISAIPVPVGTLNPPGDREVLRTFHAARAKRGTDTVNQSVSMSIDPSTSTCLSCAVEHPILDSAGRPIIIALCDQNFVPVWPGNGCGSCISIIRIDNANLHELVDMLLEIFDRQGLPDGSIVLMGTVSHLHRVGAGIYAREWTQVVGRVGRRWPNVRVGPLVPIIREDCPGGVQRELIELASWLSKVYSNNAQGFQDSWTSLINTVISNSTGATALSSMESYTLCLPTNLDPHSPAAPSTFCTYSSRPSILHGMDKGSIRGLLDSVTTVLGRDFNVDVRIGTSGAENATEDNAVKEPISKLVLVGASNLKRAAASLSSEGFEVINLSIPGWVVSPTNVSDLCAQIKQLAADSGTAFVFDLFGNSVTRYERFDGSTALPNKEHGGYHLPGEVQVCTDEIFKKLVETVLPLIDCVPGHFKVIFPPQPRYMFAPCCDAKDHCTNLANPSHQDILLGGNLRLRALLKKQLCDSHRDKFWVADTCMQVRFVQDKAVQERVALLKLVSAIDGVHFTMEGYRNVAKNVADIVRNFECGKQGKNPLFGRKSAAFSVTG